MSIHLKNLEAGIPMELWYGSEFEDYTKNRLPKLEPLEEARLVEDTFMDATDRKRIRQKKPLIDVELIGASNYRDWDAQFRNWLEKQDQCARHFECGLISKEHIDPSVMQHYKNYDVEGFQALVSDIDLALVAFLTTSLSKEHFPQECKLRQKYHKLRNQIDEHCLTKAVTYWPKKNRGEMWIDTSIEEALPTPYSKHTFLWSTWHDYHIVNDKRLFWWFRETDPEKEASEGRPGVCGIGAIKVRFETGPPFILPNVAYVPGSDLIYSEMAARSVGRSITLTSNLSWNRRPVGRISPRPQLDLGILSMDLLPVETAIAKIEAQLQRLKTEERKASVGVKTEDSDVVGKDGEKTFKFAVKEIVPKVEDTDGVKKEGDEMVEEDEEWCFLQSDGKE
ncbi:hypothetical protein C7M61_003236 [Candidozyma pseudohaemuli]|uniref:Uncharacterized protein n=1 Tax=Candidozyma pseudohaemuli TaxID=418784 RepID=A0A2P7YPW1_9ASCO|nr:hypothetical protein C7M61_003236 [[Candida] pseudohaemulonii]PSK37980.1 hypothetical protein C7M61_003236 [[Candida] pseudohaemulonii]